jgi:small subunit ribosomal protein S20
VATHESSKKRARQAEKRRIRNRHIRSGVKGVVKAANTALATASADVVSVTRNAESVIRRAASKGVLSKKQASRRVARLARRAHQAAAAR